MIRESARGLTLVRELPVIPIFMAFCFLLNAPAAELPPQWKSVQALSLSQAGLVKFSIPLETLASSRPGLEDLRLFDDAGRELPYLLQRPVEVPPLIRAAKKFEVSVNAVTTVILLETGFTQTVSGVTLETPSPDFLKAVKIETSQNQRDWATLAQGQPIFRQANGATKLHISFPPAVSAYLRLTLDDQRSRPIPVTGAQIHAEAGLPTPAEPVAARIVHRTEEGSQSRLTLELSGANFTLARLTLETPEPLFVRPVSLSQEQFLENEIREAVFFGDSIYRVVVEGQAPASKLTVGVDIPIRSREVFLTIENHDNPPLLVNAVKADRRPAYLTFLAAGAGSYQLLTGNLQAGAPRYELAALKGNLQGAALVSVEAGPLTTNAFYRPGESLADIEELAAPLDVLGWRFRKRVPLPRNGVQQVELDLELMAHASNGLGDLRLIRNGRQVPYLLERTGIRRSFSPEVNSQDDPKRQTFSRWTIAWPYPGAGVIQMTATSASPYFQREARLYEERPNDERGPGYRTLLGSAVWVRRPGAKPRPLTLPLTTSPVTDKLILEMDNGDNPPLVLEKVELWYPVARLLFKSSADSNTFLYYGNRNVHAPKYDLELTIPALLASEKTKNMLGAEERLKPGRDREALAASGGWIFWGALTLVVVVLLALIRRLLPPSAV